MLVWFSKKVDLYAILDQWRNEVSNYNPDDTAANTWYVDNFEVALGTSDDHTLYDRAVRRLFRYRYYPDSVLKAEASFIRDDRPPEPGDQIAQRIKVIPFFLDAVAMNIVHSVWRKPDNSGLTIITSEKHYEVGEWTATISRKPDGEIALIVCVISRPRNRFPFIARVFGRILQKRAHRLAWRSFALALRERGTESATQPDSVY